MGPRVYFDQLPTNDPNRCEVVRVIRDTWPSVTDFNRDWNTSFHDWAELEHHPKLPVGDKHGYELLADRWLAHYARSYFQITTSLIRKYDPNHLILGCRYRGWAPPEVPEGAKGLTDAQSLNYYASDALLDYSTFRSISHLSDQPLIVSEYTFHALDGRSGDHNLSRFPAQVADQGARAAGYREMTSPGARAVCDWRRSVPMDGRAAQRPAWRRRRCKHGNGGHPRQALRPACRGGPRNDADAQSRAQRKSGRARHDRLASAAPERTSYPGGRRDGLIASTLLNYSISPNTDSRASGAERRRHGLLSRGDGLRQRSLLLGRSLPGVHRLRGAHQRLNVGDHHGCFSQREGDQFKDGSDAHGVPPFWVVAAGATLAVPALMFCASESMAA